jgi:4-amino-4-deoxy-L-arabinose transferase-like glycosyltransferase
MPVSMSRPARTALVLAVALALLVRLALALHTPATPIAGDPVYYDDVAVAVASGHGWERAGRPTALHPPAWPAVLGAAYALTGHDRAVDRAAPAGPGVAAAARARLRVGRVLNALLGTAGVALIALIALELFSPAVVVAAAVIAAVATPAAVLGVALLSEPLFVALVLFALYAVLRHRRSTHRWRWLVAAGVACGLAVLTRANGAALLLPLGLAVWTERPRLRLRSLLAPAVLVVVAVLTVAPWTIRNAVAFHSLVPVSTDLGPTLAGTYNAGSREARFRWRPARALPPDGRRAAAVPGEVARSDALSRVGLRYLRAHPVAVLEASAWNTARLLELDGGTRPVIGTEVGSRSLGDASVAGFAVLAVLALAGAFTRAARGAPRFVWLIPILFWLTTVPLVVNFSRFRAPIDPFLILLAATAVAAAAERLAGIRGRAASRSPAGPAPAR